MQSEQRIHRMQADGILTATQAELLRESLAWHDTHVQADTGAARRLARRRLALWLPVLFGGVVIIGFFMLMSGSAAEPAAPQDVAATLNDTGGIGQMNKGISGLLAVALFLIAPLILWM